MQIALPKVNYVLLALGSVLGNHRQHPASAGPRGIEMDVIADALEIAAARAIDDQRFVAPGEKVAEQFVPPVEPARVGAQKPFLTGPARLHPARP
jgi:hypothetical protein